MEDKKIIYGLIAALTATAHLDGDIARVVMWDDSTTWEEVEEWLRRRYPGVDPY